MALSAYLAMMAVAIVYGAYKLADEIEDSQFPLIVPSEEAGYDVHYCADRSGNLNNFSESEVRLWESNAAHPARWPLRGLC